MKSNELADNRNGLYIHGLWEEAWNPIDWLNREAYDLGVKRMRFAINELDVGMVDWSQSEFLINPQHETFINSIAENGMINTFVLSFWDKANHPDGWEPNGSRFKTEEDIQRYLQFVRFIVNNMKGRVQYYEIWNEPDVGAPTQRIEAPDYINLVKRVVPIIREEYPQAKIVVSVSGTSAPQAREYLFGLVNSDMMPLVDVVSWHPTFGSSPQYDAEYYFSYPEFVQQIKDAAYDHGFNGEFWATEITFRSPECTWCPTSDPLYSSIIAAKYYARGIMMHLGMDVTAGVGGMSFLLTYAFPTVRNISTVMAGAMPVDLPVKIESEATNIKSYPFTLPNGDTLIVLWTDSVAVDEDNGVESTIAIPGISVDKVTAIDVLYGLEQELMTSNENDALVIRNLLVKDYPIVLRLSPN